ncbi:MAG: mechanosensitive ion channel [Clostridia bacterium]|nr:mechanosensitive ion channel [Clostridia bacterium]
MSKESIDAFFQMLTPYVVSIAWRLVAAFIVLGVGFKITKKLVKLFINSQAFVKMDSNVSSFLRNLFSIGLKTVIIITAAGIMGIPMTSFVTILGSLAVAIGLSLQGSLSNIAGGVIVLLFKPFAIGDYISVDNVEGVVTEIGLYYTQLKSVDNQKIVVPNAIISNQTMVNVTHQKTRRVDLQVCVSYESDIDTVKEILLGIADAHSKVINEPDMPMARLAEHGDHGLIFSFRCWCNSEDYWDVRFDLLEEIKTAFDMRGINIPYPQMQVHINQ